MAAAAATTLVVKWSGQEYTVEVDAVETVATLKRALQEKTQVCAGAVPA
jgi:hypothetical protein